MRMWWGVMLFLWEGEGERGPVMGWEVRGLGGNEKTAWVGLLDGREGEGEETGYRESRYIILAERRKVMSEMKKGLFMDFATGCWYTADLGFGSSRCAVVSGLFYKACTTPFLFRCLNSLSTSNDLLL
jgi:hypothetical protein